MLFNNAVSGGKAQARASAHILEGKKGIKYLFQGLAIHALSRIRHSGQDLVLDPFGLYEHGTAVGHGIPGIGKQIHKYLTQK